MYAPKSGSANSILGFVISGVVLLVIIAVIVLVILALLKYVRSK